MFWNAGHRFDFVRAYGILGITLDRENKFRLIKFTPFATACKEGGGFSGAPPQLGQVKHLSTRMIPGMLLSGSAAGFDPIQSREGCRAQLHAQPGKCRTHSARLWISVTGMTCMAGQSNGNTIKRQWSLRIMAFPPRCDVWCRMLPRGEVTSQRQQHGVKESMFPPDMLERLSALSQQRVGELRISVGWRRRRSGLRGETRKCLQCNQRSCRLSSSCYLASSPDCGIFLSIENFW